MHYITEGVEEGEKGKGRDMMHEGKVFLFLNYGTGGLVFKQEEKKGKGGDRNCLLKREGSTFYTLH